MYTFETAMIVIESIPQIKHTDGGNFFLIAGPCVVESEKVVFSVAEQVMKVADQLKVPYIFKSSYKKANRSKLDSFSGIGDEKALKILDRVRSELQIPVLTDIHSVDEATLSAEYVDILQIPAFLCRQTELLVAAAKTGKVINIKKGQFLAATAMQFAAEKVTSSGNNRVMLTERGTMFGYQDLIVDFRNIAEMQKIGFPVVLDITHSLQQPNQNSGISGGRPEHIESMGLAGIAVGVDGIFMETHPDPSSAKSDGANMLPLHALPELLEKMVRLRSALDSQ